MTQTTQTNRFALFFFLYFAAVSLGLSLLMVFGVFSEQSYLLFAQSVCYLPPLALYFLHTKKPLKQTLRLNPLGWKNILLLAAFSFAIQPLMSFLSFLTTLFFPNPVMESAETVISGGLIPAVFSMAVFPAVFEELSFRGIFLSGYRFLGKWKRAFVCALLFGLLHMNLQQFPYAFCVGFIFCFLVERTDSIWASVLPHMFINGTTVFSMFSEPDVYAAAAAIPEGGELALLASIGLLALLSLPTLAFLLYLFLKVNPEETEVALMDADDGVFYEERFLTPSIYLIFALFILMGVLPYFFSS